MGAWERGVQAANALHIGELHNENDSLDRQGDILAKYAVNLEGELKTYQQFLAGKANGSAVDQSLEIFGSVRPDLLEEASDGAKRIANLKLFAWFEWFQQTLGGQAKSGKNQAPILRGLSDAIQKTGTIENPELAVSALNDIAARMEFTIPMENGVEWVESRIQEIVANGVEFDPENPTIPLSASIKPGVPNLMDYEEREGKCYDPFKENHYGIANMAVR